jgi:hypothetical protein
MITYKQEASGISLIIMQKITLLKHYSTVYELFSNKVPNCYALYPVMCADLYTYSQSWALPLQVAVIRYSLLSV